MATKTTNYNLTKPSGTENADINVINANMDIIDSELKETNDTVSEHYTMLYEVYTTMPDKADKNHTHSNYATKTDLVYKQDSIKAGTGITIGTDGVTIGHSNSVDGKSVGSATAVPVITYDAQGHITGTSTKTIYPPTSKGTAGQYWRSDGDGTGTWMTPSTAPTSDNNTLISSGGVYTALQNYAKSSDVATSSANGLMSSSDKSKLEGIESGANKTVVDSALSSSSTNPLQNKVVNNAIYNLGVQIRAEIPKITASTTDIGEGSALATGTLYLVYE